jgi:hypothetical protein
VDRPVVLPEEHAPERAVLLFDGIFLLRPELTDMWDFCIFVDVNFDVAPQRALTRDVSRFGSPADIEARYLQRYFPAQKLYLEQVRPQERADAVVRNDEVVFHVASRHHIPMPERDYSHRSAVDKLGIKPGDAISLVSLAGPIDGELTRQALDRAGRDAAGPEEPADVVLISADASTDAVAALAEWRSRIKPAGGIWLLTPKRGRPGYVNQNELISAGPEAGLVDNKIGSVSDEVSGMRFVIRRKDRERLQ